MAILPSAAMIEPAAASNAPGVLTARLRPLDNVPLRASDCAATSKLPAAAIAPATDAVPATETLTDVLALTAPLIRALPPTPSTSEAPDNMAPELSRLPVAVTLAPPTPITRP